VVGIGACVCHVATPDNRQPGCTRLDPADREPRLETMVHNPIVLPVIAIPPLRETAFMKRIFLFLLTNLAVVFVLSIVLHLLGADRLETASGGLDINNLLIFSAVLGFGV
jgi:hypothetical protein